jgi:hypothetical protein
VLTKGPAARVSTVLDIPFERPRRRDEMMELHAYYELRRELLGMLTADAEAVACSARR